MENEEKPLISEEIRKADQRRMGKQIREKKWMREEERRTMDKLPNELRQYATQGYDDYNCYGDY